MKKWLVLISGQSYVLDGSFNTYDEAHDHVMKRLTSTTDITLNAVIAQCEMGFKIKPIVIPTYSIFNKGIS